MAGEAPRKFPRMTSDNVIAGIAVGATTAVALVKLFGVVTDAEHAALRKVLNDLIAADLVQETRNTCHTLVIVAHPNPKVL